MKKQKPTIQVDDREPDEMIKELKRLGVNVERKRLNEGDYILGDICIERKTNNDFVFSIIDDRLKKQTQKMLAKFSRVYVLVSGHIEDREDTNFSEHAILGKMASLTVREGVTIITVDNDTQMAYLIERMATRQQEQQSLEKQPLKKIEKQPLKKIEKKLKIKNDK